MKYNKGETMGYFKDKKKMEEFIKGAVQEREKIDAFRAGMIFILGESTFEGIYAFFERIFSDGYDVIVLMSRRCLVLCQIFKIFFIMDGKEEHSSVRVLGDKAIPYCHQWLKDKRVVIVDDILIHGRTVHNMYDQISRYTGNQLPQICVYAADIESNEFLSEMEPKVHYDYLVPKGEWRNLSNRIVNCIYAANKPYTSFITAYFQFGSKTILESLDGIPTLHRIANSHPTQQKYKLESFYFYEEREDRERIFRSCSQGEGFRLYRQEETSKVTIIPYVFLREMTIEDAWNLSDMIASCLEDSMPLVSGALAKKPVDGEDGMEAAWLLEYKMRLLTCVLSSLYWNGFVDRHSLTWEEYQVDFDTLDKSFGFDVSDELGKVSDADIHKLLNLNIKMNIPKNDMVPSVEQSMNECTKCALQEALADVFGSEAQESTGSMIQHYFHKNWFIDEKRAETKEERCIGLTVDQILAEGKKHNKQTEEILAWLVNAWDCGIATASFAVNAERGIVGCYNTSGEQSYKIVLEAFPNIMLSLIFVSKIIRKTDKKFIESQLTFEEYREQKLIDLLDAFKNRFPIDWYEDVVNIIRQEKGYLNVWNQTDIIWDFMGNAPEKDKSLVEEFVLNNL